jgi:2'-5' RNA ligase
MSDNARLFIALWPTPAVRETLCEWRDGWQWPPTASPVGAERLHLTLHFLGAVRRERVSEVSEGLGVPFSAFELVLGRAQLWPHGIAVLRPAAEVPSRLVLLHGLLREALQRLQLPTEERPFRPHVTLARRAHLALAPSGLQPLRWRVRGYALVESQRAPAGGYAVLRRYA